MTDAGVAEGVVHSPLSAALHADRATALLRLKQWQPCRTDALRALAAQNDCKVSERCVLCVCACVCVGGSGAVLATADG